MLGFNFLFSVRQQWERDASPHPANIHLPSSYLRKLQTKPPWNALAKAAGALGRALIGAAQIQMSGEPRLLRGCSTPAPATAPAPPPATPGHGGPGVPPKTLAEMFPFSPQDIQGGWRVHPRTKQPFLGMVNKKIIPLAGSWVCWRAEAKDMVLEETFSSPVF